MLAILISYILDIDIQNTIWLTHKNKNAFIKIIKRIFDDISCLIVEYSTTPTLPPSPYFFQKREEGNFYLFLAPKGPILRGNLT